MAKGWNSMLLKTQSSQENGSSQVMFHLCSMGSSKTQRDVMMLWVSLSSQWAMASRDGEMQNDVKTEINCNHCGGGDDPGLLFAAAAL